MTNTEWWRTAVVYQIYIRSFADSDGDGIGDINGIRNRLGYLRSLGVDAIWITPWYPSPLLDGGYDVSDYRNINELFGSLDEAATLIEEAHDRGIRVIIDLVPNHTSWDHEWFREAIASAKGSRARSRYHFAKGKGWRGRRPPTNWQSVFGGSTWERLSDGAWYLHIFDKSQPDLNWENEEVQAEFDEIIRFWLDRGVDGLRIDVAHGMIKDPGFPDIRDRSAMLDSINAEDHPFWDRPGIHDINRRWRAVLDEYDDRMMVAEAWVNSDRLRDYLRPDEYHQSFNFDLLSAPWDADEFAAAIERAVTNAEVVGASPTWVLSNHDVMRHVTRYALPEGADWRRWPVTGPHDILDEELGRRRARSAVMITLALPGSAYLYQGEELGLPEVWDLPEHVLDDPTWERTSHEERGRDGCRVPVPWTTDGPSLGFGEGDAWLPQPPGFALLAVARQADAPESMLAHYRRLLARRRDWLLGDQSVVIEVDDQVLTISRESGPRCVVNMGDQPVSLPSGVVVEASEAIDGTLPPDCAVWLATGE